MKKSGIALPQSSSEWGDLGTFPPGLSGTWLSPWGASADGDPCGPCLCGWFLDLGEEGRGSAFPEVLLPAELWGRQICVQIKSLLVSN